MTHPVPPGLSMLSWHVFRVPTRVSQIPNPNRHNGGPLYIREITTWPGLHDWLNEHMTGEWTWGENQSNTRPYFIKEKGDAMLFKLTWFDVTVKPVFR